MNIKTYEWKTREFGVVGGGTVAGRQAVPIRMTVDWGQEPGSSHWLLSFRLGDLATDSRDIRTTDTTALIGSHNTPRIAGLFGVGAKADSTLSFGLPPDFGKDLRDSRENAANLSAPAVDAGSPAPGR